MICLEYQGNNTWHVRHKFRTVGIVEAGQYDIAGAYLAARAKCPELAWADAYAIMINTQPPCEESPQERIHRGGWDGTGGNVPL